MSAFCVDQTECLGLGSLDQLEPIATEAGPVAVPIDWEIVQLVWDAAAGYPTDSAYRDYHGRTVHDLKPWNIGGRPYRQYEALVLARRHARDFVDRDDVSSFAFDLVRHETEVPGEEVLVHKLARFFAHASTRLTHIASRKYIERGRRVPGDGKRLA